MLELHAASSLENIYQSQIEAMYMKCAMITCDIYCSELTNGNRAQIKCQKRAAIFIQISCKDVSASKFKIKVCQ